MRIGVGGIWQETNAFVPQPTTLDDFSRYLLVEGPDLLDALRATGTELGGALRQAREERAEVVPLLFGAALPAGIVRRDAFESMLDRLLARARAAPALDAVVLSLHGALLVEGHADPELAIVRAVRALVGGVPVAVTLDYHANVSPELAATADLLVGYRTYPHVDMADRGAEAVHLALRAVRDGFPRTSFVSLPLLTVPVAQESAAEPMRSILAALADVSGRPGVWSASTLPGFAYGQGERLGFGVYVAASSDPGPAVRELAAEVWRRRHGFTFDLAEPSEGARLAARGPGPVVLADVADNVGGGSPGDGTVLLHALREAGVRGAVACLWDPQAVAEVERGADRYVDLPVGGRSDASMGPPFRAAGHARRQGPVVYRRTGSYMTGQRVDMGRVVVIDADIGSVVLTEHRVVPFDDDHLTVLGLEPRRASALVAKGAIAWKAAFGSYAARTVSVRTPGYCPVALDQLRYPRRRRPLFPLDDAAAVDKSTTALLSSPH